MSHSAGTVVIVDDDAAVRSALRFMLELEGFDVRTFGGGEALLAEGLPPETGCLIVDMQMPGMSGIELIAALRARRCLLPAILITAAVTRDVTAAAAAAGIEAVLVKPLAGPALLNSVSAALAGAPAPHWPGLREIP